MCTYVKNWMTCSDAGREHARQEQKRHIGGEIIFSAMSSIVQRKPNISAAGGKRDVKRVDNGEISEGEPNAEDEGRVRRG